MRRFITSIALLAAAASSVVAVAGCGSDQVVPDVRGQPAPVAQRILADLGFNPVVKEVVASVPAGLVSGTDPAIGKSTSSDGITVRVSKGPGLPIVPETANLEGDLVAAALIKSGYRVEQTMITSALVRAGTIVRSSPPVGKQIAPNGLIVLLVSGGAHTTAVPDLFGVPLNKAIRSLKLARLRPLVVPTPGIGNPGHVGAQSPSAGQVSAVGTTVRLWTDSEARETTVPKLVGLTAGSAGALLQNRGVEPRFASRMARIPAELGAVLSQSPKPGAKVRQGQSTLLVVGTLPTKQQLRKPGIGQSFGLLPNRTDVFSFLYEKAACPLGRGAAQISPDLAVPYRKDSAQIVHQGPVDLGDGRIAQAVVVKTNGDFIPGSAEVAIRVAPCPQP